MGAFTGMSSAILSPFLSTSSIISAALVAAVLPVILAGMSVNIAFQGLSIVRGAGGQHLFLDLFATNFRAIFVLVVALGAGAGYSEIVAAANDLQTSLVSASGASTTVSSAPAALDSMLTTLGNMYAGLVQVSFSHITVGLNGMDLTGITMLVDGTVIAIAVVLYSAFAFVEVTAIQAAIYLIVSIGPLFVAAAAFRATSSYFSGWLNGLLRYTVEIAFQLLLVGIGINIFGKFVNQLSGMVPLTGAGGGQAVGAAIDMTGFLLQAIAASVVLVYLTLKVDSIAASVFGGASISGAAVALAAFAGGAASKAVGGGQASGGPGGRSGDSAKGTAATIEEGMSRALESHGFGFAQGPTGTGSITGGGGRSGLDTLGAGWMAEFANRNP